MAAPVPPVVNASGAALGPVLNLKQVARRLGVHYMTAYRYVRQGQLEGVREGTTWLVPEAAVERLEADRGRRQAQLARPPGGQSEDGTPGESRLAGVPAPVDGPRRVDWAERLYRCLLAGDEASAWRVVRSALAAGRPASYCYADMLSPALVTLGAQWEAGEITVADQYVATAVAARVVARLGAVCRRPGRDRGTVVFGAPAGELHALPVSIAADLVRTAGFAVLELGANAPAEAFALAALRAPRLVAVGVGITGAERLGAAQEVVDAVRAVDAQVPIVIGGQAAISAGGSGLRGVTAWAPDGPAAVAIIEGFAGRHRRSVPSGGQSRALPTVETAEPS